MKHALALLVFGPLLWFFDVGTAFCLSEPGQFWEMYRAQRVETRGAYCAYRLVRDGRTK